jgi:cell division protein FtsX
MWARYALVAVQVTASGLLLAATLLVATSAANGTKIDLGYDLTHLTTVSFEQAPATGVTDDAEEAWARVVASLEALPGVTSVSRTTRLPLDRPRSIARLAATTEGAETTTADHVAVDAAFFDTLGMDIRRGRPFTAAEGTNQLAVAVVNETLARRLWPGGSGVGEQIVVELQGDSSRTLEVVGVSADTRYGEVWAEPTAAFFSTLRTVAMPGLMVRTSDHPTPSTLVALRSRLGALPHGVTVVSIETGSDRLSGAVGPIRSAGTFFGGLAAVAGLVALLGLHTTLSHTVEQRTREIALRQALGATPAQVTRSIFQAPLSVSVVAAVAGCAAALTLAPLLASQTRGLESNSWVVSAVSTAVLVAGCLLVAFRAAVKALRLPLADVLRNA